MAAARTKRTVLYARVSTVEQNLDGQVDREDGVYEGAEGLLEATMSPGCPMARTYDRAASGEPDPTDLAAAEQILEGLGVDRPPSPPFSIS